jgi:modulator of FtsH protease HflC
MKNASLPIIGAILAAIAFVVYSAIFVVNARQQAVVLRFGEIINVVQTPGVNFKIPVLDTVQLIESRKIRLDLENIRVQVQGGRFYDVDAFVVYSVSDAQRFREVASGSLDLAEQRLVTRLNASLRRVYGLRGFEAALSEERTSMMREVRDELRTDAASLGLTIDDVRIRRTDLTQEVSQQTYARMQAERLAEAERLRARGREAAQRIRAVVDRQVVEITAEARRESEVLRGEGDAERNKIFAEAFNRDPAFFEFYRSMIAYQRALQAGGTTMVLSPDSEFFRFFNESRPAPRVDGAPLPAPANP